MCSSWKHGGGGRVSLFCLHLFSTLVTLFAGGGVLTVLVTSQVPPHPTLFGVSWDAFSCPLLVTLVNPCARASNHLAADFVSASKNRHGTSINAPCHKRIPAEKLYDHKPLIAGLANGHGKAPVLRNEMTRSPCPICCKICNFTPSSLLLSWTKENRSHNSLIFLVALDPAETSAFWGGGFSRKPIFISTKKLKSKDSLPSVKSWCCSWKPLRVRSLRSAAIETHGPGVAVSTGGRTWGDRCPTARPVHRR